MSMTNREKLLAGAVGVACSLFGGQFLWSTVQSGFESKEREIATLRTKLQGQELEITEGKVSTMRLMKALPRSISKKVEFAQTDYMAWLIETANSVGLQDPKPRPGASNAERDGFTTYKFSMDAEGTLREATQLLYAFESKPFLHRVTRFVLQPRNDPKEAGKLQISMDCEVLSLPMSKDRQPTPKADPAILAKSIDDYEASIYSRNLFEPRNNPPQLRPNKSIDAVVNIPVDYSIEAKDPDPNQKLKYALDGESPAGLKLDESTGKITWTGREIGKTSFNVIAMDSGLPSQSTKQTITIEVKEPPPPPPSPTQFDVASQAKLSGLLAGKSGSEAWVFSRTEGKTLKLREGDELKLGEIRGKVVKIGASYMEVETDGKRWTVGTEETIADAFKRGQVD
ncbi:MAG: cadherin repeat domain-containing protein [Pirellula sp.]|jgi:hypothetical protein|nr:cadherin repeat domain-containing protein [Pirellula sp.]